MSPSSLVRTIALAALVVAAGCASRQAMMPSKTVPPNCEILPAPAEVPDTISVALFEFPDLQNAPLVHNASEALLFHHLYETLITVDCRGEVRGALAVSWRSGDGGRRWTFELREGARFWNGKPVTAWDVEWWWQTTMRRHATLGGDIDSIAVAGERTLVVFFEQSYRQVPRLLSSSDYAVAAPSYDTSWPIGSGEFRLEDHSVSGAQRILIARPAFGATVPVLRFVHVSVRDARDLIENTVDLLVTADPDVIDYARGRRAFSAVALPWDRTYVLLSTSRAVALRGGKRPASLSAELKDGLADDAVRRDARGCDMPFWWEDVDECENLSAPFASLMDVPSGLFTPGPRRVLYDAADPVARDLAERIVALASGNTLESSDTAELVAAVPGLTDDWLGIAAEAVSDFQLALSLRNGDDFAYVLSLPHRAADPCFEARKLLARAPWVVTVGDEIGDVLIPLVDTRAHLIADGHTAGAVVDWYGNLLLYGWSVEGEDLP
jgi:hypothetical protein